MITSLRSKEIDVGIGLTEGWIAGLGRKQGQATAEGGYKLIGTYVETPLCWAISTGADRKDVVDVKSLKGGKCGVSRIGSGSYVMAYVLADQQGWLSPSNPEPFSFHPLSTFAKLREGVNDSTADFFMWEHFTSKRYYDNGEIRRVGEIYTPWSSWKIVAREDIVDDERLLEYLPQIDQGIAHFEKNQDEAVDYISTSLDYSREDATEWLGTVKFTRGVKGVKPEVVENTITTLRKAGVLVSDEGKSVSVEAKDMCS